MIIKPVDYPGIFTYAYMMFVPHDPTPIGYRIPEEDFEITNKLNSMLLEKTAAEIWQYAKGDIEDPIPAEFEEIDRILRYLLIITDGPIPNSPEVYKDEENETHAAASWNTQALREE